ncbi:hypothetical protein [Nocardia sp. NBC_01009]|uniref:hypothetical protein n=1 Tax=Nocardia sp. NBC_01009 TaxID=2975996 RepID=UPI00386EC0C5|nr:hypothetical protein OHA42_21845 [Nocardia sp. NBC_01009]
MDRPDMQGRPGEAYRGDWSEWAHRMPAEPEPHAAYAPDYADDDDDVFARLIDRSRVRRRWYQLPKGSRRWMPALLASLGAAALLAAAFVQFRGAPAPAPTAASSSADIPVSATIPATRCPAEKVGNRIQGNGAGGVDSGPAAIFAFQYAYYVTRSSEQARAVIAPNAAVSSATDIQHGIDTIPAGTTHCVTITPGAFVGQYLVRVSEQRPNALPVAYNAQLVTTARAGGRTLITGISAAE